VRILYLLLIGTLVEKKICCVCGRKQHVKFPLRSICFAVAHFRQSKCLNSQTPRFNKFKLSLTNKRCESYLKAFSKPFHKVLEIHEDLEDLYQKRHTWQRPSITQDTEIWTGQKFSLPKGEDAQSVYSRDNNGIPKMPLNQVHPGSIPNAAFMQVSIENYGK
jgi:hypothetical protein